MKPKVIWQHGARRIVADLNESSLPQVWFEIADGQDAMGNERWIDATKGESFEFLQAVAIHMAKEKLP